MSCHHPVCADQRATETTAQMPFHVSGNCYQEQGKVSHVTGDLWLWAHGPALPFPALQMFTVRNAAVNARRWAPILAMVWGILESACYSASIVFPVSFLLSHFPHPIHPAAWICYWQSHCINALWPTLNYTKPQPCSLLTQRPFTYSSVEQAWIANPGLSLGFWSLLMFLNGQVEDSVW